MTDSDSITPDSRYTHMRTIHNDLVLLGNALMTRNNDVTSIHDFVTGSINQLGDDTLKKSMHNLNERVVACDNDDDRLRLIAKMQFKLAEETLPYLEPSFKERMNELSSMLKLVEKSAGESLRGDVSRFQIDILPFLSDVDSNTHTDLHDEAKQTLSNAKGKKLTQNINSIYARINGLIQPSIEDIVFDESI